MLSTSDSPSLDVAPTLAALGLSMRNWREDWDFQRLAVVQNASCRADGLEKLQRGDDLRHMYENVPHFLPRRDLFLVEHESGLVGMADCRRRETTDGQFPYRLTIFVLTEWRDRGVENDLLDAGEKHLRSFVNSRRQDVTHWFELAATDAQPWLHHLALTTGYQPVRTLADMVCSNLTNVPDLELPSGIETRPVKPEHLRRIWEAESEAFSENWAQNIPDENDYASFLATPNSNLDLWQIAWEKDQIVGAVMNYVDEQENELFNHRRGYTENIIVRKPWRGRGIGKAMVVKSMKMFRDMGFDQTALGVDTESATGAIHLYKSLGYEVVGSTTIYRKAIKDPFVVLAAIKG